MAIKQKTNTRMTQFYYNDIFWMLFYCWYATLFHSHFSLSLFPFSIFHSPFGFRGLCFCLTIHSQARAFDGFDNRITLARVDKFDEKHCILFSQHNSCGASACLCICICVCVFQEEHILFAQFSHFCWLARNLYLSLCEFSIYFSLHFLSVVFSLELFHFTWFFLLLFLVSNFPTVVAGSAIVIVAHLLFLKFW